VPPVDLKSRHTVHVSFTCLCRRFSEVNDHLENSGASFKVILGNEGCSRDLLDCDTVW
jgi:hypothetical protein